MPNTLTQRRGWSKEPVRSHPLAGDLKRVGMQPGDRAGAQLGTCTERPAVDAIAMNG